jgi:hypothetical protein
MASFLYLYTHNPFNRILFILHGIRTMMQKRLNTR